MSMKPRPVKVRVNKLRELETFPESWEVALVFDGKKFVTERVFFRKESAQALADKLQAVFDKAAA